jgi:phage-related minor tail protein
MNPTPADDNEEIMELLRGRLALGRERYGHGVRVDEDVTAFGPAANDWELMALEEMLDGLVYITASIIRLRRNRSRAHGTAATTDSACEKMTTRRV